MPKPISFGKLDFEIVASLEEARGRPEAETPFRILILGDFTGRESRGERDRRSLGDRRPIFVDRDNLEEVMAKLGIEIEIPLLGKQSPPVRTGFSSMDDFSPDCLFERLDVFQALKDTRRSLKDPSVAAALARQLQEERSTVEPSPSVGQPSGSSKEPIEIMGSGLLNEIVDETVRERPDARPQASSRPPSDMDRFVKEIVSPYLAPEVPPEQEQMVAAVDAAASELMRRLLHHPDFQAIQAAWRGLSFLASRLETDERLKLYLLDVAKAELAADVGSSEDLASSGLYKLLVEETVETPGGEPWAVVAGAYTFGPTSIDAALLGRLAKIASSAGAPFISAANAGLVGAHSWSTTADPEKWKKGIDADGDKAWTALRGLPEASYVGLALPRFLLRLPYGTATDPIECFDFEEMGEEPTHEDYLWANPSFACAYLLGKAFSERGWDFEPGAVQDVEDLPLHVSKQRGESVVKPCAEALLTEPAAERMLDTGLMPLLSFRNQDFIRLARFQSIAAPPTPLWGRWGG